METFREYAVITEDISRKALDFATKAHQGQFRSDGSDYIRHPERVAQFVQRFKQSHNIHALVAAAYLHDTIEDTDTTHEDLEKLFGGLVASLVQELTSDEKEIEKIGKTEYLSKKLLAMSSYALVVKLADRLDNVQDIATARSPKWRQKYAKQTNDMLNALEKGRVLSGTHKNLISAIREKIKEVL